jgi:hypothetical protein
MRVRTAPWTPRWAAGALVAAVVLAGCSDPDQPGTVPRTTPAPTTSSPSPSPTSTEDQVEAAVRAYYAELETAARTSDASDLRLLIDEGCPCFRAVEVIDKNRKQGETIPDARISLDLVKVHDIAGRTAAAEVRTKDSAYDVLDAKGNVVDHISANTTHLDLSLVLNDVGRWVVSNFFNLEGDA